MNNKLISVIIPSFKRVSDLERAISSIINQTYINFEVLVIDNNEINSNYETDTRNLITRYNYTNVKYFKSPQVSNAQVARNFGIKISTGDYICFLDNDDSFLPNKLLIQSNLLDIASPDVIGVYCGFNIVSLNKIKKSYNYFNSGDLTIDLLLQKFAFCGGSCLMLRNELVKKFDYKFNEFYKSHQDWYFLLDIMKNHKLIPSFEILVNINIDDSSTFKFNEQFLIEQKNIFINKILPIIEAKSTDLQNKILQIQYYHLASILVTKRKYRNALKYLIISFQYKNLTIIQFLKFILKLLTSII
jgi:glycosyltransferase involved in cell wall biosynthesis